MSQETLVVAASGKSCILVQGAEWSVHDCTATSSFACMGIGSEQVDEGLALLQKWSRRKHSDKLAEPMIATSVERVRRHPHLPDCIGT